MDFLLRIFFSGLIAFIPSADGTEVTVLLLDSHAHTTSDGGTLVPHKPVVVARALECQGQCTPREPSVAQFLFADKSIDQAADALQVAVLGGSAWPLADTELSIRGVGDTTFQTPLILVRNARPTENGQPKPIPTTSQERQDFSWVPDLKQIMPALGELEPALFAARPPATVVAARLRLRNGKLATYSVARADGKVKPVFFRAAGSTADVPYSQAVAGWVSADIVVSGDQIELVAQNFNDGTVKTMKLKPKDGLLEMAILNLPYFEPPQPDAPRPTPRPGQHFEAYYDIAKVRPDAAARPVPYIRPTDVQANWDVVHPREALWSALLEKLRLDAGRGPYDVTLCPTVQAPPP
ncbi:MAG TPA: hypothetical protein VF698_02685 [Thermoanaerobaculia bacterium]